MAPRDEPVAAAAAVPEGVGQLVQGGVDTAPVAAPQVDGTALEEMIFDAQDYSAAPPAAPPAAAPGASDAVHADALGTQSVTARPWAPADRQRSATRMQMFRVTAPIEEELERFRQLRLDHPEYAAQLVRQGEQLVELAARGELDSMVQLLLGCREGELLAWTHARMFRAACCNGRVDVVRFMLANGISRKHPGLDQVLHELVAGAKLDAERGSLLRVLPVLVREADFDVNSMRRTDGRTPLHLACESADVALFKLLVLLQADVNAVAYDDSLPLNCAQRACSTAKTAQQASRAAEIVRFLGALGADDRVRMVSSTG